MTARTAGHSSFPRLDPHLTSSKEGSREELAILLFIEPGAFDVEQPEAGDEARARRAAPELDDLELLSPRAPTRQVAATAAGTRFWLLGGQGNAGDAGDRRRHTINSVYSPYHGAHGYRKDLHEQDG